MTERPPESNDSSVNTLRPDSDAQNPFSTPSPTLGDPQNRSGATTATDPNSSRSDLSPLSPENGTGTMSTLNELPSSPSALHEAPGVEAKYGSSASRPKQELQGSGAGAWEADSAALVELEGCKVPIGMSEKLGGARLVGFDGVARRDVGEGVERECSRDRGRSRT